MAEPSDRRTPRAFSEHEMRRILERAFHLDQRRHDEIAEKDLSAIAEELGVSRSALSAAIAELESEASRDGETRHVDHRRLGTRSAAIGALIGLVPGVFQAVSQMLLLPGELFLIPLAALFGSAALLAADAKGPQRHFKYQLSNLGLWGGFMLGWSVFGNAPRDLLTMSTIWCMMTAAGGAALIQLKLVWQDIRRAKAVSAS